MVAKAKNLGKSLDKTCDICYLLESTNQRTKFHLYKNACIYVPREDEKYICEHCLAWIKEIRKRAVDQCNNPKHDSFKDMDWWWKPKEENVSAIEVLVKK